jgi:hypothetical protein
MFPRLVTDENYKEAINMLRQILEHENIEFTEDLGRFHILSKKYYATAFYWFKKDPEFNLRRKQAIVEISKIMQGLEFVFQIDFATKETLLWKILPDKTVEEISSLQEFLNPS